MRIEHTLTYDGDPGTVFDVLSDPDYVEEKCWATFSTEAGVSIELAGHNTVIRTVRVLPAKVPSYAKTFLGDHIEVDQTETWGPPGDDGARDGTIAVSFKGTPMKVLGTQRIEPSDGGTLLTVSGEVKAGIPLVGGKLEGFAAEQIVKGLDREAAAANARLA